MIFVSAIVPVYNSINTLERAVRSLLIQPEINEIFIVDDGSSDGSYELAKKLESEHSLITVLTHENRINKGASAARNLGLKFCTNEWIQFLDADDELLPKKIFFQIQQVESEVSLIVSNSIWINSSRSKVVMATGRIWEDLITARLGNTCSNLWKGEEVKKAGYWNEDLINTQEYDLLFRILKRNPKIKYTNVFLTRVYEVPNSISRSSSKHIQKFENQIKLRKEIYFFLRERGFLTFRTKIFYNGYLGTLKRNYKVEDFKGYNIGLYLLFKIQKSIRDRF